MKTYAPNYYKSFKCIADRCRHSCCKGWNVYLDEGIQKKYRLLEGELGDKIRAALCEKEDGICFEMKENGNCPFLNEKGLCEIILQKGEDYISEICTEHPRFYNSFSDRWEVGLGLSCEEAARIMLSFKEPNCLIVIDEDNTPEDELWEDEAAILQKRALLFDLLEDSSKSLDQRVGAILDAAEAKIPSKSTAEWADFLSGLEVLDPIWLEKLQELSLAPCINRDSPLGSCFDRNSSHSAPLCRGNNNVSAINSPPTLESAFKNLIFYFLYRHVSAAEDEADLSSRTAFAIFSYLLIRKLWEIDPATATAPFETLCELGRMYSAEIEYSEENTCALIDEMSR